MSGGAPRGRAALLLLVTFAAGAAAGVAADRQLRSPAEPAAAAEGGRPESRDRGYTIERFADDLGLTAGQRAAIAPVLEDTRSGMRELSRRIRPEYRQIIDSARARIEAVLTPEQVTRYRELLEREERRERDGRDEARDRRDAPGEDGSAGTGGQH
jgi:Spy/CpxP family protein refolding chaperone